MVENYKAFRLFVSKKGDSWVKMVIKLTRYVLIVVVSGDVCFCNDDDGIYGVNVVVSGDLCSCDNDGDTYGVLMCLH